MIIRKLFKFEGAHIVRNCTSRRCKSSIHGHSYKVEVLLNAPVLDQGQMVYDFGLMKGTVKDMIDSFDHAITLWYEDTAKYQAAMTAYSERWVSLPVSPSAEQYARVIFALVHAVLKNTEMNNGEYMVNVHSVIVHETDTGYAQAFREDVSDGFIRDVVSNIIFSEAVREEWSNPNMMDNIINNKKFINPKPELQVEYTEVK